MDSVSRHGVRTPYLRCKSGGLGIMFSVVVSRLGLPVLTAKRSSSDGMLEKKIPNYQIIDVT